ncbi:hypothetical protein [Rhodococcoides fascians]|uniref:hypothetical protein n=1 Tax=Rhodococcoides fascians TaxID=1828 RepID=UPI00068FD39E|nr:hypothetical protein [Rhodococcus fascians]
MSDSTTSTESATEATQVAETAAAQAAEQVETQNEAAAAAVTDAAAETPTEGEPTTFSLDYVEKLRAENAKHRTSAKTAKDEAVQAKKDADAAAEAARRDFAQNIGKAIGLIEDDKPVDPADLVTAATAKAEQAEALAQSRAAEARAAQVELALYRAADQANADSSALLDSRSFLAEVADLDPSASDFADQVTAAVTAAVDKNPKFRKANPRPAVPRSGADLSAGNGSAKPIGDDSSIEELLSNRRKRRGLAK